MADTVEIINAYTGETLVIDPDDVPQGTGQGTDDTPLERPEYGNETTMGSGSHQFKVSDYFVNIYPDINDIPDGTFYCGAHYTWCDTSYTKNTGGVVIPDVGLSPLNIVTDSGGYPTRVELDSSGGVEFDPYYRNIFIYDTMNYDLFGFPLDSIHTNHGVNMMKFITELNPNDVYYDVYASTQDIALSDGTTLTTYRGSSSTRMRWRDDGSEISNVRVASYMKLTEDTCCLSTGQNFNGKSTHGTTHFRWFQNSRQDWKEDLIIDNIYYTDNYNGYGAIPKPASDGVELWTRSQYGTVTKAIDTEIEGVKLIFTTNGSYYDVYTVFTTEEAFLWELAQCGIRFKYNNVMYKPIISGGMVTGYTDDDTKPSELDGYTGINNHKINTGGGNTGGGVFEREDDDLKDIGLTLNANGNSFIAWYAVSRSQMESLISWLNGHENYTPSSEQDTIPAGFNAMSHIVGVMQAPVSISSISATTSADIKIGGHSTGVTGGLLGNQGSHSVLTVGTYSIPKKYNNFLDYEPYTKISLYIPYCGTVDLPPSIFVGHTVKVQLIYDIFSGECMGVVFRDGTFYTSLGGNFMTMHAISAENVGAIKQAVVNGCMSVIGSGAVAIGGIATGNIPVAVGGLGAMLGGTAKNLMDINGIAPTMRGNSGGRCNFYKPNSCIIYITRPQNALTDGFISTQGLGYNRTRTLATGQGYTVVSQPVISGDMTDFEKQEIINALKTGVIL